MIISKILNNNAVVALDENKNEVILLGKGIGFKKKIKQKIESEKIEKEFVLTSSNELYYLEELIRSIPPSYITATNEIIEKAKEILNVSFRENNLFISLVDHIAFAIERKKANEYIDNPLLMEIKKFYPNEYRIGKIALNIIEKYTNVRLDEVEAGYIAFNLINATLNSSTKSVKEITFIMKKIISIIESFYGLTLDVNSVYYIRLTTHLKYFLYRLFSNKVNNNDDYLFKIAKTRFRKEYDCAIRIGNYLEENYGYKVPNEELGYLMIHINSTILHNKEFRQ